MRVTRYSKIRKRLAPALAGRLINELRDLAILQIELPVVTASPDPHDNYVLAMAASGSANFPPSFQAIAARRLDVMQPRLNDLRRGRTNDISLDALTVLGARVSLDARMRIEQAA